jgi:hypothetical protein
MKDKQTIKERLSIKTVKELKMIYTRIAGHDLLRGSKGEMVNVLHDLLMARSRWAAISRPSLFCFKI